MPSAKAYLGSRRASLARALPTLPNAAAVAVTARLQQVIELGKDPKACVHTRLKVIVGERFLVTYTNRHAHNIGLCDCVTVLSRV